VTSAERWRDANTALEATGHSAGFFSAWVSVPVARASAWAFGFFLQTEGNLSRVNDSLYDARERRGDEGARCYEGMRAHRVRPLPDVLSLALSRDPL